MSVLFTAHCLSWFPFLNPFMPFSLFSPPPSASLLQTLVHWGASNRLLSHAVSLTKNVPLRLIEVFWKHFMKNERDVKKRGYPCLQIPVFQTNWWEEIGKNWELNNAIDRCLCVFHGAFFFWHAIGNMLKETLRNKNGDISERVFFFLFFLQKDLPAVKAPKQTLKYLIFHKNIFSLLKCYPYCIFTVWFGLETSRKNYILGRYFNLRFS